ncbi:MAG: Gfo/Idh/MocA family oxidoreductase, partial [Bryobacter sp.]|nr:Gfo/Idh/MocA family oxidoreductase [Bryobacter sp.]
VLLITPPGHRPLHFEAAVDAKKHIFIEKPIATDPVGVRRVMEAARRARDAKLTVLAGTESRYSYQIKETVEQIHSGAIGDVLSMRAYYLSSPVFHAKQREPHWSEVDWQHRNWYSFIWICGDQLVEQVVHQIDLLNWVMKGPPVKAVGIGGRAWRRADNPLHGNIWDNMNVEFTYANGVKLTAVMRHYPRAEHIYSEVSSEIIGSKGRSNCRDRATSADGLSGGLAEQTLLIGSIRGDGPYFNTALDVCESTLACIMGREAAYSGQLVTWDQVMRSNQDLYPKDLSANATLPPAPIPVPGEYRFI